MVRRSSRRAPTSPGPRPARHARDPVAPARLGPASILALQRQVGNGGVARALAARRATLRAARIQRVKVDEQPEKIAALQRALERVLNVGRYYTTADGWVYEVDGMARRLAAVDEDFPDWTSVEKLTETLSGVDIGAAGPHVDPLLAKISAVRAPPERTSEALSMRETVPPSRREEDERSGRGPLPSASVGDVAAGHARWLRAALESEQAKNPVLGPFVSHEEVGSGRHPYLAHFQDDDPDVIWRFTSEPLDEKLYIAAGSELEEIMRVTAKHSGGNDKSNQRVKTLSFGRNRGALLGTAASIGGDKNVLDIIHSAEYLYGVKISSLAAKGISAHPALYRTISMFETEYVLVRSPGLPAVSLHDIASLRHPNPLKGRIATAEGFEGRYQALLKPKTPNVVPAQQLEPVPPGVVDWLLSYGRASMQAADAFKGMIQDKEHKPEGIALPRALIGYITRIDAALGRGPERAQALETWLEKVQREIAQAMSATSQREQRRPSPLRSPVPTGGAPSRPPNLPSGGRGGPPTPRGKPVVKK